MVELFQGTGVLTAFSRLCKFIACLSLSIWMSGCVTVLEGGVDRTQSVHRSLEMHADRAAINQAIAQLEQTPWPSAQKASVTDRMTSMVLGGEAKQMSLSAQQTYLAQLRALTPQAQVLTFNRDAKSTLDAAAALCQMVDSVLPDFAATRADIASVERAISNLRSIRNVYVATLKDLSKENPTIDANAISMLKLSFFDASRDLSERADLLASKLAERATDPDRDTTTRTEFVSSR